MRRVWLVARREWREQLRQPVMLAVIATTFTLILGLCLLGLWAVITLEKTPEAARSLAEVAGSDDPVAFLQELARGVVGIANWLLYTQILGIVAVLAGHSMLHDRQSAVLPFLLLAPIRRWELLLGKVLGAMGLVGLLYFLICGVGFTLMGWMGAGLVSPERLPPSASWALGFYVAGPGWAALLAVICAIVSSLARDVRTAQQVVWGIVLVASFGCATLLSAAASQSWGLQLAVAGVGWGCAAVAVAVGQEVISRDLGR